MRKWVLLLLFSLHALNFAAPLRDLHIDPIALQELATGLGISSEGNLVAEMGALGLRRPGLERWEIAELPLEKRLVVLNWATEQGMFSECAPSCRSYDKALIFGATAFTMKKRLNYLIGLWNQGIRFDEVVWLTGDCTHNALEGSHNELEAAHLLWEEAKLQLPVTFVAAPMKLEGTSLIRPNTADTILAWLSIVKEPCKALFISDQPFCGYQFSILKNTLPNAFTYDVAGPGVDPSVHPSAAAITLDSIARWIWVEAQPPRQQ
jgi:hypothetical protein